MKKFFLWVAGIFCIVVGVAGIILPVLPGWALIFLGLSMIAPVYTLWLTRKISLRFLKPRIIHLEEWKIFKVDAGFTTRRFPVFLKKTKDLSDPACQTRFLKAFGASSHRFVFLSQVHGGRVIVLDDPESFSRHGFYHFDDADGVITNIRGLSLLIMTADCLSVFFYTKGWIGIVHAGWRGTKEDIGVKALKLICEKSGAAPSDVKIAFGPSIGKDHYEVGKEFKDSFREVTEKNGKYYFDLFLENKRRLIEAGALELNMAGGGFCTVDQGSSLYSFRKEKDAAGRMFSFATILD